MPFFKKGPDGRVKYVESEIDPETGIDKARQEAKEKGYDEILNIQKGDRNVWIKASDFEGAKKKGYDLAHVVQGKQKTEQEQLNRVKEEQKGILGTAKGALSSVARGATAGFSDELTGAAAYLGSKGKNTAQRKADYEAARDEERLNQQAFQEEHPFGNFAGELAGGMAVPIAGLAGKASLGARAAKSAGLGAGLGAVSGAGEAKSMKDIPDDTLKGAALGAGIGGAIPVVGAGARAAGLKGKELWSQGTNTVRNFFTPEARMAQAEARTKLTDKDLVDYYHGGGRERFNEGAEESSALIANQRAKDKLNKDMAQEYERENPYKLEEIRKVRGDELDTRRNLSQTLIDEKLNDLENKILSGRKKISESADTLSLKQGKESLEENIKEFAPELLDVRKSLLGQRKELGKSRDQFFDYVDSEFGQSRASVEMIKDIEKSLKGSLEDVSLVDPRIIGDYTKSAFQNQSTVGNIKKAISGEVGPDGKIFPVFDKEGNLVPIQSAGHALKVMSDLITAARGKAGRKNANGEYKYSDDPEVRAARRLVSRLGDDVSSYLKKLNMPQESIDYYRNINRGYAKNYQAEEKINSIMGKVGKRGEFVPSESKTKSIVKDKYKRDSLLNSLKELKNPELDSLISGMESAGLRVGDIEKTLRKNSLGEKSLEKAKERLEALKRSSGTLNLKKDIQSELGNTVDKKMRTGYDIEDYKRSSLGDKLSKLREEEVLKKGESSPEIEKLIKEREALDSATRYRSQMESSKNPLQEYGPVQEASDLLKGGLEKLYTDIGPQNFSKIKDALGDEKTMQLLRTLGKKYGLSESDYIHSAPALAAGAFGGPSAYGATSMIIQHLNTSKDPFRRLANVAKAKQSLKEFAEKVKSGEETPARYYKLVQALVNAGIDVSDLR